MLIIYNKLSLLYLQELCLSTWIQSKAYLSHLSTTAFHLYHSKTSQSCCHRLSQAHLNHAASDTRCNMDLCSTSGSFSSIWNILSTHSGKNSIKKPENAFQSLTASQVFLKSIVQVFLKSIVQAFLNSIVQVFLKSIFHVFLKSVDQVFLKSIAQAYCSSPLFKSVVQVYCSSLSQVYCSSLLFNSIVQVCCSSLLVKSFSSLLFKSFSSLLFESFFKSCPSL